MKYFFPRRNKVEYRWWYSINQENSSARKHMTKKKKGVEIDEA